MRKIGFLALAFLILLSLVAMTPLSTFASESPVYLMVFEWYGRGRVTFNAIPPTDNSMSNPDYKLLPFHWYTTAEYWINLYQKDLIRQLTYSNKTIIGNLKTLTELGVLTERMEKIERDGRTVWVKAYRLSDIGKWFALLIAEEKELSDKEKAEILQNIFRNYIKWVKNLSEKLYMDKETFKKIFDEEMKNESHM